MEISIAKENVSATNNFDAYRKILGISDKRLPSLKELPDTAFLPGELMQPVEESILQTLITKNEIYQRINWARSGPKPERRVIGNEKGVSPPNFLVKTFLGKKTLLEYHTHPDVGYMSAGDIATSMASPRSAYIKGVLSPYDNGVFIFQTNQSSKLPISAVVRFLEIITHYIETRGVFESTAVMIEKYGYGYYEWNKHPGKMQKGDMANGIVIKRLTDK